MKRERLPLCLVALLVFAGCGNPAEDKPQAEVGEASPSHGQPAGGTTFVFTDGSSLEFVGSKVTGSHSGGFKSFEGEFRLVNGDPTQSHAEVTIDATSLWADNERLTGHLKSADFFDVETHGTARFTSTEIAQEGDRFTVTGNLDLHGVTKGIQFPAHISVDGDRVTIKAEFVIMRFDFGIAYKGKADDLIRDEVVIKLDLVAAPAAQSSS